MQKVLLFIFAIMVLGGTFSIAQNSKKENPASVSNKVEAYYFHFNIRCVTCRAVEAQAKTDILSLYPGEATFTAINLDDASSKPIAERLRISGQTLLIVKGDKKINLTNEGFMYATTNPAKLKSIIKQKVDAL